MSDHGHAGGLSPDERDRYIVGRLRGSAEPVSGEALAAELGMSRVALWKRVESLRAWGYGIEASRKGYALDRDDGLAGWELDAPGPVVLHATVGSTMDEARALAIAGAPSGATVLALVQSAGRGRSGGSWDSPSGGLYLSFVVRSPLPPSHAGALSLETAAATVSALGAAGARGIGFRWPNEIVVSGDGGTSRKAGGILVEACGDIARADFYVAGVGLAMAPGDLVPGELAPGPGHTGIRRAALAAAIVRSVVGWAARPSLDPARWVWLAPPSGLPLSVTTWDGEDLSFVPAGFDRRGDLVQQGGGRALSIGECTTVRIGGDIA